METYQKKPYLGAAVLLAATIIWGFAYIAQSEAMDYLGVLTYSCARILLAGIVLVPAAYISWKKAERKGHIDDMNRKSSFLTSLKGGMICGVFLCLAIVTQQYGIANSTVGKSGFLTALYIVLVPVFGVLFHRKVTWMTAGCVVLAVIGSYFLCMQKETFTISYGDWMLIADAVLFAFQILFIDQYLSKGADPVLMTCFEFWTAGLILVPFMILLEKPVIGDIIPAWKSILYTALASGAIGYSMQMIGQRELEPTAASLLMSLESVFAALFGWIILGEKLSSRELSGCFLVMAAVVLSQLPGELFHKKTQEKEGV